MSHDTLLPAFLVTTVHTLARGNQFVGCGKKSTDIVFFDSTYHIIRRFLYAGNDDRPTLELLVDLVLL